MQIRLNAEVDRRFRKRFVSYKGDFRNGIVEALESVDLDKMDLEVLPATRSTERTRCSSILLEDKYYRMLSRTADRRHCTMSLILNACIVHFLNQTK